MGLFFSFLLLSVSDVLSVTAVKVADLSVLVICILFHERRFFKKKKQPWLRKTGWKFVFEGT